ncbi:MAG: threonine--tRNA ligase [Gammaproteobacteria bacterium RIFCSPHIGHO2_12_FULL_35_23]|nr:MAG: threonine--tRNA ligase [Gammaproteobacteria bacterium RIFCSPHIGHO2_12_FULL_35_23]
MMNTQDIDSEVIPSDYPADLFCIRHSSSHLLAWAVKNYFAKEGEVQFGIGPAIQDGFYYDFLLPRPIKEDDLIEIEAVMKKLLKHDHLFVSSQLEIDQALNHFNKQPFKCETIQDIVARTGAAKISTYTVGEFTDLCRGPHVKSTKEIHSEAVKLLSFSGAYWKGDNTKQSLTRIYGTAWRSKEELEEYITLRAEAEKRDHRKIGKQLGLFHFDETAPGMPYWLPDGLTIYHELVNYCRSVNKKNSYAEVSTPLINRKTLWETSGHWEFYRDDMYLITTHEDHQEHKEIDFALKPMNCPNAMVVFNLKRHSYRDLPLRLADCDTLHRNEASGALHGLLRVRQFHQDDAHIFLREDQIESECTSLLKMCQIFYATFNMTYTFRLGTRPEGFIGDTKVWGKAQQTLINILDKQVGRENYIIAEGEGAFYGPKIDILMHDSLKRTWQMGTIQLDFQLPERFNCKYVDESGNFVTPVVIHRAIYGSLERFIGVLIEHLSGNLPVWLAPCQVVFVPIADKHIPFCKEKVAQFEELGIRCYVDERNERMNLKIRDAEISKIPYILVFGDKEIANNNVSYRQRGTNVSKQLPLEEFLSKVIDEIKNKLLN